MPKLRSAMVRLFQVFNRDYRVRDPRPTPGPLLQTLEDRRMLSASINSAGNTVITPSPGAQVIYVSSSGGNDSNNGMSPSSPVRTLERGIAMLRNYSADELLLKSGDTWYDSLGYWYRSGISPSQPLVIGAYGTGARPMLDTGNSTAFSAGGPVSNVDIIGLRMTPNARSGVGPDGDPGRHRHQQLRGRELQHLRVQERHHLPAVLRPDVQHHDSALRAGQLLVGGARRIRRAFSPTACMG